MINKDRHFIISFEDMKKIQCWAIEQDLVALEEQKKSKDPMLHQILAFSDYKYPYYGAIGGSLTYNFTPNSIGMVITVTHGYTKAVLDLTDFDNW